MSSCPRAASGVRTADRECIVFESSTDAVGPHAQLAHIRIQEARDAAWSDGLSGHHVTPPYLSEDQWTTVICDGPCSADGHIFTSLPSLARTVECCTLTHATIILGNFLANGHFLLVDAGQLLAVLQHDRAARRHITCSAYDLKQETRVKGRHIDQQVVVNLHVFKAATFQREQPQLFLAARLVVLIGHLAQGAQRVKHLNKRVGASEECLLQTSRRQERIFMMSSRGTQRTTRLYGLWIQSRNRLVTFPALHLALTNAYLPQLSRARAVHGERNRR